MLNSINNIVKYISSLFTSLDRPVQSTPKELLLTGTLRRSGLSYLDLASEIIAAQEQAGIPIGLLRDGSENIVEKMEAIRVQKIVEHLITQGLIEVVIPPAAIQVNVTGMAGVIPVVGTGINPLPIKARGVIK